MTETRKRGGAVGKRESSREVTRHTPQAWGERGRKCQTCRRPGTHKSTKGKEMVKKGKKKDIRKSVFFKGNGKERVRHMSGECQKSCKEWKTKCKEMET